MYQVDGEVELFPQADGWYFVAVPIPFSYELAEFAERGLIPITATLGTSTWDTSLMPKGDSTHFIPLNAKVRKSNHIDEGDRVTVRFQLRSR